ncbi:MAG: SDR family oxidoreductase [Geminicoccaceae bacterium]|nr:SDR family oxidoreductase [Geminicoccaceae bacterium]
MFQSDLLAGQRVLISGGGTGLGKSMGRRFMELGADLVICGRRADVLAATAAEHESATGRTCTTHALDIRDVEAVEAMVGELFEERPPDVLVNNAAGNILARSEELSPRAVDAVTGIVMKGSCNLTLACGRRWLAAERPATVLSIVTSYAWTGSAFVLPSAMAKAAVLAMTRSLAVEWGGRGIRLNAIAPGPFPTQGAWERLVPRAEHASVFETRNPLRRPGEHRELADLAAYLIAGGSGFVNGEVVTIDGGEWLKGAGQFSFLEEMMSEDDWQAMRAERKR